MRGLVRDQLSRQPAKQRMRNPTSPPGATTSGGGLTATGSRAQTDASQANSPNTRRAYRAASNGFNRWCDVRGLLPLPAAPDLVGAYLSDRAGHVKTSNLHLHLTAIRQAHRLAGYHLDSSAPQIRQVLRGIARVHGRAVTKKQAATSDVLRDSIRALPAAGIRTLRDGTLLLVGFFAALRRSEISSLNVDHVRFTPEGAVLVLPRRKTDQEGLGTEIGIAAKPHADFCPVANLRAWIAAAGITDGALFRSISKGGLVRSNRLGDRDVARVLKGAVAAAGYNPESFGAHSLRAGFATTAGRQNVPERIIMLQTGHKSLPVLRGYIRRGALFTENATLAIEI